jgi:phosphoribosylaminoimidazole-succinocarboxamide synthase
MLDPSLLTGRLDLVLDDATIAELPNHYRGKVRDNYDLPDGRRIIIATDRLSAFDRSIAAIPCKGQVLTQTARFWFDHTGDICPNHVIEYPDPNVLVCRRLAIMPVEIVVRGYMAGTTGTSIWSMYKTGRREMYGHRFADGLRENQKLPQAILTPTTKARDGEHDEPITPAEIVAGGLLSAAQWDEVSGKALALFARGREMAAARGLILVDTKYEIGRRADGELCFIDEIHTPDSSRYWYADDYQTRFDGGEEPRGLDKEYVRRTLAEQGYRGDGPPPVLADEVRCEAARRYIQVCELITGRPFVPDTQEPIARIRGNLKI